MRNIADLVCNVLSLHCVLDKKGQEVGNRSISALDSETLIQLQNLKAGKNSNDKYSNSNL